MRDTPDMREMRVSEQRYQVGLAVNRDGETVRATVSSQLACCELR